MSLISLLKWHKFTVQTNEYAAQSVTGSIQRKDAWINVPNALNINGHLQNTIESGKRGKDNTILEYGIRELEIYWTIFHNHVFLSEIPVDTGHRILVHKNPRSPIDLSKPEDIRVFEVISAKEPVSLRQRGLTLFEIYLKQIFRQSI